LTTDFGKQSQGVGMMEAVIAEIAPKARVIHYMHGIEDYDIMSAARVLETVQSIMPAIHVCVRDPGVGTARRPLAILTHRGDIVIGPDNGVLLLAVTALDVAVEAREISHPAVMRHPMSAVFHGRDVFCPASAHLANGLSFHLVGEPVDTASLAPAPFTNATQEDGRWLLELSTSTSSAMPISTSPPRRVALARSTSWLYGRGGAPRRPARGRRAPANVRPGATRHGGDAVRR
jgi:S-adenosyl-L-methionine hydrolase (adenosine-forming)